MSTDHAKAKEMAEWAVKHCTMIGADNLAACYLDLVKQHGELRAALDWVVRLGENHYEDCVSLVDEDERCDCGGAHTFENARETLARIGRVE